MANEEMPCLNATLVCVLAFDPNGAEGLGIGPRRGKSRQWRSVRALASMSAQQHTVIEEIGEHDAILNTLLEAHDGDANKLVDSIADFLARNDTSNAASRIAPQQQSLPAQPKQQGVKSGFFGVAKPASAAEVRCGLSTYHLPC